MDDVRELLLGFLCLLLDDAPDGTDRLFPLAEFAVDEVAVDKRPSRPFVLRRLARDEGGALASVLRVARPWNSIGLALPFGDSEFLSPLILLDERVHSSGEFGDDTKADRLSFSPCLFSELCLLLCRSRLPAGMSRSLNLLTRDAVAALVACGIVL